MFLVLSLLFLYTFQDNWVSIEYSFCNPQHAKLTIFGVWVTDKTPKPLETVKVKAFGSFDKSHYDVTGGSLEVDISLGSTVLKTFHYAVCEYTSPFCPIRGGENVTMIIPQEVPVYVFPNKYKFTVKAFDQTGEQQCCVNFNMVVI